MRLDLGTFTEPSYLILDPNTLKRQRGQRDELFQCLSLRCYYLVHVSDGHADVLA